MYMHLEENTTCNTGMEYVTWMNGNMTRPIQSTTFSPAATVAVPSSIRDIPGLLSLMLFKLTMAAVRAGVGRGRGRERERGRGGERGGGERGGEREREKERRGGERERERRRGGGRERAHSLEMNNLSTTHPQCQLIQG